MFLPPICCDGRNCHRPLATCVIDDVGFRFDAQGAVALLGGRIALDPYKADSHYCPECAQKELLVKQHAPSTGQPASGNAEALRGELPLQKDESDPRFR